MCHQTKSFSRMKSNEVTVPHWKLHKIFFKFINSRNKYLFFLFILPHLCNHSVYTELLLTCKVNIWRKTHMFLEKQQRTGRFYAQLRSSTSSGDRGLSSAVSLQKRSMEPRCYRPPWPVVVKSSAGRRLSSRGRVFCRYFSFLFSFHFCSTVQLSKVHTWALRSIVASFGGMLARLHSRWLHRIYIHRGNSAFEVAFSFRMLIIIL